MQRSKLLAVVVAVVASGAAAFFLVGGAAASSWHEYKGDLYAGHAYGIDVPAGADSLEFLLAGDAAGAATLGVYAPEGKRLGLYELSAFLPSASVANPDAGRYVVYVYDLTGALTVRVDAEQAPQLDLEALPLVREDVEIGTFESAKLDKVVTSDLRSAPVFVTLLYEGSARALDATVASGKGDVAIIRGETGTAFAPGVWTSLKGERSFRAANLEGSVYTVNVHAEQFEGTMLLSTLSVDFRAPLEGRTLAPPMPNMTAPISHPGHDAGMPGAFPLLEGTAIAFTALAGTMHLADPALLESTEQSDDCSFVHGLVTLYAPDDSVLAVVELNHDEPTAVVELPVAGEYVAYVTRAQNEMLLGHLPDQAFPTLRNLEIGEERFEVAVTSVLPFMDEPAQIELTRVPLALGIGLENGTSLLGMVEVSNEAGTVAYGNNFLGVHGMSFTAWSGDVPENFRAGVHEVRLDGVYEGTLSIASRFFLRASEIPLETRDASPDAADDRDEAPSDAPPAPPAPPMPPMVPMVPQVPQAPLVPAPPRP